MSTIEESSIAPRRPVPPAVEAAYQPFFDGLAEHKVVVPRCASCGQVQWPPRGRCVSCRGGAFEPSEIDGHGTIYTYTIVRRGFDPWFAEKVPYGLVVGELQEGVRLLGNVFGPSVEGLRLGLAVRPAFNVAEGLTLLDWEIDEDRT